MFPDYMNGRCISNNVVLDNENKMKVKVEAKLHTNFGNYDLLHEQAIDYINNYPSFLVLTNLRRITRLTATPPFVIIKYSQQKLVEVEKEALPSDIKIDTPI